LVKSTREGNSISMAGIVIVAHTPIASAMLSFAEHTGGGVPVRVRAVDIPPYEDTNASFDRVLKAAYGVNTGNGVLILTDVMGATPANVASKLESLGPLSGLNAPVIVLAGLNLPMLMRCISHRGEGLEELAKKALAGGQHGILRLGAKAGQE
jgi:PTS system mannose-specific IIA component